MRLELYTLDMPQLGISGRTIRVLLPNGYSEEPERHYPVLYMQDGHNLFDPATATYGTHWGISETMDRMADSGDGRRIIVVGVDCNHAKEGMARLDEYSPWINRTIASELSRAASHLNAGGLGAAYLSFITDSLMPWVSKKYRVLEGPESTAIAGSSMGGIFSLYALYERPEVFGLCGAFSSAIWFAKRDIMEYLAVHYRPDRSVYLDIGTAETSDASKPDFARRYLNDTLELRDYLATRGLPAERLLCVVDEGAEHSERSWSRRFPGFIDWSMNRLAGSLVSSTVP